MRIQRGFSQQSANSAGQVLGPREPATLLGPPPLVTTLGINLATGVLTNQRRAQQRRSTVQLRWQPQRRVLTATGTGNDSPSSGVSIDTSGTQYAQQFTVGQAVRLADVQLVLGFNFSPTDSVRFELHADSGGTPDVPVLASATIRARDFSSGSGGLFSIPLGATLAAGSYWVVLARTGATDASNNIIWYDSGLPSTFPATTARNTGSGWVTGAFSRALTLLTQLVYDDLSAQLPMIGVKPPTQIDVPPPPVVTTLDVNFAARGRETIKRFPLQGWTGMSVYEEGGSRSVLNSGTPASTAFFGQTGNAEERIAESISSPVPVTINSIRVGLNVAASPPTDSVVVTLQTSSAGVPSGVILQTVTIPAASLPTAPQLAYIDLPFSFKLDVGVTYWLVFYRSVPNPTTSYNVATALANAAFLIAIFNGTSWTTLPASTDIAFLALTGGSVGGAFSRNLGPRPPMIIRPVLTQPKIVGSYIAPFQRVTLRRGPKSLLFPPATLANPPPALYGLFVYPAKVRRAAPAFSRLSPPTVVAAAFIPSPIDVSLAVVKTRNTNTERFPLPGWEGWGAVDRLSGFAYSTPNGSPLIFGDSFGDGGAIAGYGIDFTNIGGAFDFVDVAVRRTGTPTDNLVVEIRTDSAGVPSNTVLASATVAGSTLPTASQFTRLALASITVNRLQTYWIVLRRDGANDASNYYVLSEGAISTGGRGAFFDGASWVAGGFFWAHGIGIEATAGSKSFYGYKRNLGPWPPLLQNPLPTQQQQTISVRPARVRRATPVFSRLAAPTVVTTAAFTPRPISVSLATIRNIAARRFPLQGWEQDVAEPSTWVQEITVANPTVWYRLGEAQGATTAVDQQGARNGTYPASAVLGQPSCLAGDSNTAVRLIGGGNTNAIQIAGTTPIVAGQTNSSVEMWVRSIDTGSRFFWTEKGSGNDSFEFTCAGGSLTFRYVEDNGTIDSNSTFGGGSPQFANGTATHIAFTRAGNSLKGYINGVLVGTLTPTLGPQTDATFTVYLGGKSAAAGTLTGTIDEAAVYQRTLSADEIFQHYQAGARVSGSAIVYQRRFLGPRPPTVIATIVAQATTIDVAYTVAVARRQTLRARQAKSQLFPPATLAQPPPALYGLFIYPTKVRRVKPVQSRLAPPTIVAAAFTARPVNVALVRTTPRPTTKQLRRPTVVRVPSVEQREQTIQASLARTRPRHTFTSLPETIITAAAFSAEPITVALSRVRPRRTTSFLTRPVTLSTFNGPLVATVRTRPRLTITKLNEPTAVRVPSVEQQEDTVKVSLTRTRPRPTVKTLAGPTTLREFVGPQVTTVRTKPRSTVTRLGEPTVVRVPSVEQQEQTIRVALVRIGPRPTSKCLNPPRVVRVPSVEQVEQTVRVALTHTRPRPTVTRLEAPAVVRRPAVGNIATTLVGVKTRRDMSHQFSLQSARQRIVRETGSTVTYQQRDPFIGPRPPQIIDPLPSQRVQTIGVYEPRIKPRPTRTKLGAPTRINPLPTLRMQTVQVALVRTRPRKTVQVLAEPTTVTAGFFAEPITVTQTRARPRPTTKALYEPTVVRVPSVEQQEDTIKVSLVRARPRPTTKITAKPIVARFVAAPIRVALTKTRPRPTSRSLRPPTVVRVASVEQARRTIKTTFTSGRPRPRTYSALGSPGLIRSAPSQQAQTIPTPFVRTRPRHTVTHLAPPTVVRQNPVKTTTSTSLVKTRPRPTTKVLGEPTVLRVASVEQLRRTILVTITRARPRHVVQALRLPTALRTFVGPRVTLVKSRPRPTTRRLVPPTRVLIQSVFQAQQTIRVKFVQTRPRPTTHRLAPPTKLAVQAVFQKQQTIRTALVQTRPQPTTTTLNPPTVIAVASVFQAQQTVRVGLTRIVPPPTVPLLRAPEVVATTTRAVATTNPSHPNEATTSATEQTEASLSSGRTDTIARVSESEATEATVSESEVTEAETEAT